MGLHRVYLGAVGLNILSSGYAHMCALLELHIRLSILWLLNMVLHRYPGKHGAASFLMLHLSCPRRQSREGKREASVKSGGFLEACSPRAPELCRVFDFNGTPGKDKFLHRVGMELSCKFASPLQGMGIVDSPADTQKDCVKSDLSTLKLRAYCTELSCKSCSPLRINP
eukprot:489208-Pelagomonas_calceolata.AAC.3